MAAQGSSSSSAVADLTFKGLAVVFGCKLAAKEVEVKLRLRSQREKIIGLSYSTVYCFVIKT